MTVVIAGYTGFVGRHLYERCRQIHVNTVLLAKSIYCQISGGACLGFDSAVEHLRVQTQSETSCLVHLVGASRDTRDASLWDANVETTRTLVNFAETAGLSRIVFLSGHGVTSDSSDPYFRAKAEAERLIASSSVVSTILRCSYILGVGDELTPQIFAGMQNNRVEIIGDGSYRFQPLLVDDVVSVILAVAAGESDESCIVDLLGDESTFRNFVELLMDRCSPRCSIKSMPVEQVIRQSIRELDPPITLSELAILVSDLVGKPTKDYLGVSLRGPAEIVDSLVRDYAGRGSEGRHEKTNSG